MSRISIIFHEYRIPIANRLLTNKMAPFIFSLTNWRENEGRGLVMVSLPVGFPDGSHHHGLRIDDALSGNVMVKLSDS